MQDASESTAEIIRDNWRRVNAQVAEACAEAGRSREDVTIVGVSKYVGASLTLQLAQAGCRVLGENKPQEIWSKSEWFAATSGAEGAEVFGASGDLVSTNQAGTSVAWHMIGHLQRNKVRRTLPKIGMLHSLDSLRLAKVVNEEASRIECVLPVLIEVNVTEDASKTGLAVSGVDTFIDELQSLENLQIRGLMAMSTHMAGGDQARAEFARVRELRDRLAAKFPELEWSQLSMGMSGDFREAIGEGATLVRIGSSLWEGIL